MKDRFGGIDLEMAEGTIIPRVETVRLTLVIDETAEESVNMVKMHVFILYLTLQTQCMHFNKVINLPSQLSNNYSIATYSQFLGLKM